MPTISIPVFKGMQPRIHPTLLPDGMAQEANNCRLKGGKIVPLKRPLLLNDATILRPGVEGNFSLKEANTLYLWDRGDRKQFLAWKGNVRVAQSNISDDDIYRIFLTGDTGIGGENGKKGTDPSVMISLPKGSRPDYKIYSLVKDALGKPEVSRSEITELDKNNIRYTRFFQTWVDDIGYESSPSKPSENPKNDGSDDLDFEYNDGDTVVLRGIGVAPSNAKARRIYKVITGSETESIQFIYEQLSTTSHDGSRFFTDISIKVKDEDAGEILPVFKSPPRDLEWMTYIENDFYAGLRKGDRRKVYFSERSQPSSWPDAYEYAVSDDIVGIETVSNTVFVLTSGNPWIIAGTSPDAMTVTRVGVSYACVSGKSICTYNNSVFYASNVGVCMFNLSGVVNITDKIWTKEQWTALNPSSCVMAEYDGALFCWFKNEFGDSIGSYIIDLNESPPLLTTHTNRALCVTRDVESDTLYFVGGI